jgi:3-oxoacyl-[acyl-carrier protein] reductase
LITGAARGIGKEIALTMAEQGANIAFTDIAPGSHADALVTELENLGVTARFYVSDASSLSDTENTVNKIIEDFGKIDILVNNAGITRDTLLMRMNEKDWDAVIQVNLKSVFNLTKSFNPIC